MLTVQLAADEKTIEVTGANMYTKRMYEKVPGVFFNDRRKLWQFPRRYIGNFMTEFKGEVYYKTPLWVITGRPAPDYSRLYEIEDDIRIPELKLPLYDYQEFGARFLVSRIRRHGFAINADSCGTGKTCHAIAVMSYMAEHGTNRFLIVVKKSIKHQWEQEIRKFSHLDEEFEIFCTGDTPKERQSTYWKAMEAKRSILITNYHNFLNDADMIGCTDPEFTVIDEAHCVKARDGVLNRNIASVTMGKPVLFLTGTPVMSRPEDIFGIVQMADPDYFGDWDTFKERYLVYGHKRGYSFVTGVKHLDELHRKVQDILIRRTEYDISVQMPETVEHNLRVKKSTLQQGLLDTAETKEKQAADEYDRLDELKKSGVLSEDDEEKLVRAEGRLKGMIFVRQVCATDPLIFSFMDSKTAGQYAALVPKNTQISPKTEAVIDLVEDILNSGEKVILFSKYVTAGRYYAAVIKKKLKEEALMYTGLEDSAKRDENIRLFRSTEDHNILIGTDAMAEGLNLAEARHVINIDLPDTYAVYQQRTGRVRRVSSTYGTIYVHNVITEDSADEKKLAKLQHDRDLDGALVEGCEKQHEALRSAMKRKTCAGR